MMKIKIGYERVSVRGIGTISVPLEINLSESCHWIVSGGSGSGKSCFLLYVLNSLLKLPIRLYIADYKGSGDYLGLSKKMADFGDSVALIDEFYDKFLEIKTSRADEHILLIVDEYAGMLVWLEGNDKKRASDIRNKIAEILMLGRSLPGGGSAWFWSVCQRPDAKYFDSGSRINFMVSINMGRCTPETKKMLFSGEDFPESYVPKTARGVILEDGKALRIFEVPQFDKQQMKNLLMSRSARRRPAPER